MASRKPASEKAQPPTPRANAEQRRKERLDSLAGQQAQLRREAQERRDKKAAG
jgi:hypothetical protein